MNIAMVAPNKFVLRENTVGWKGDGDSRVFLVQTKGAGERVNITVGDLWGNLIPVLPEVDKVVVYLAKDCPCRTVNLLAEHGLVPDQVIFVCCRCNTEEKIKAIHDGGYSASLVLFTLQCGGYDVMGKIYQDFLDKGILPIAM